MDGITSFPYTIDDEPKPEWTIEHLLQWSLLRCQQETMLKSNELQQSLQEQFEIGKQDCLNELEKLKKEKQVKADEQQELKVQEKENVNNNSSNDKLIVPPSSIHIEIYSGPHKGSTFLLQPRQRRPCFVGRSTSKKFRDRGISLSSDTETSTTHGKFQIMADGLFYFTDTDSTNGTLHKGKELEGFVPLLLENGMELLIGSSLLKISLES